MAKKLKWGTIEYLEQLINAYFEECKVAQKCPSIAELCVSIDMSDDCWKYYIGDRWKVKRKSEEEVERIRQDEEDAVENEAYEELISISETTVISGNKDEGNTDSIADYSIKTRLSTTLKKARQRIEAAVVDTILNTNKPIGAMFYSKAALGYRETTPEQSTAAQLQPTKITINILPQPPAQIIHPVQYQVIDSPPENGE